MGRTGLLLLVLAAGTAWARPPESRAYLRMDELRTDLATRYEALKRQEEFERKPLEEKLAILLDRADPKARPSKFERVEIAPGEVTERIMKWDQLRTDNPSDAAKSTMATLHEALKKRYADPAIVDYNRKERYDASRPLVEGLVADQLWLRTACFDILRTIYRNPNGLFYQPTMDARARKDKRSEWQKYITKEKRR